jgi:hypothetical protein
MSMQRAILRPHQTKLRDQLRQLVAGGHRRMVPVCRVVTAEGDLVELARSDAPLEPDWRIFYAELRQIAADGGYKRGWAAMKFKEKFGTFPPWSWNDDQTATATVTTLQWTKSRQIAYARMAAS